MFQGYSIPIISGHRGTGLGNEIIPWGKAWITSQELGLTCMHPSWSLNPRQYFKDFQTSRLDFIPYEFMKRMPGVTIDTTFAQEKDDYADVVNALNLPRKPLVLKHASGMSGGYFGIYKARDYISHQIAKPHHVSRDLYKVRKNLEPNLITVAVHIRIGDFVESDTGPKPGEFNKMIPLEWYTNLIRHLKRTFQDKIQFLIFSDKAEDVGIKALMKINGVHLPIFRKNPLLSDLILMSTADLLICSISSMSLLAGFLSNTPYVWFEPHLENIGGLRSI